MKIRLSLPPIAALALVSALCAAPTAARSEGAYCGPRDRIVAVLHAKHGETRRALGLQRNAQVMETYANIETGSWTIIVAMPSGQACLVATGEAFQAEAGAEPVELDDPA